jgi:hypothetical protein
MDTKNLSDRFHNRDIVNSVDIDPDCSGGLSAGGTVLDLVKLSLLAAGLIVLEHRDLGRFCSSFSGVDGGTRG